MIDGANLRKPTALGDKAPINLKAKQQRATSKDPSSRNKVTTQNEDNDFDAFKAGLQLNEFKVGSAKEMGLSEILNEGIPRQKQDKELTVIDHQNDYVHDLDDSNANILN